MCRNLKRMCLVAMIAITFIRSGPMAYGESHRIDVEGATLYVEVDGPEGAPAVVYAARHPERVQVLALYDASVGRADVAAQREGREKAFAAQAAEGIAPIERPKGWNNNVHKDATNKALAAALRFDNLPGELAKITAPTMVSTGDYDPNIVSSREIAAGIPGARLTVMKNVGHGSILQRPDLATQLFLSFVDEHRARFE